MSSGHKKNKSDMSNCPVRDCFPTDNNVMQQDAHQLVGQAKRCTTKIRPKDVGGGIFGRFANFDNCQSEAAGDSYPVWL